MIVFAWVLRRPDYVPAGLIAVVFLLADLLFMRPPGLWTALVLIGSEFLRAQRQFSREAPFLFEWTAVGALVLGLTLLYHLVWVAMLLPSASVGLVLISVIETVLVYPVVVVISHFAFGVRRIAPGESDAAGRAA